MVKNGLGSNEGTAWCGKTSEKNPHVGRPAAGFEPLELRMQSGDATLLATMLGSFNCFNYLHRDLDQRM
jgi:hypothetical protein